MLVYSMKNRLNRTTKVAATLYRCSCHSKPIFSTLKLLV